MSKTSNGTVMAGDDVIAPPHAFDSSRFREVLGHFPTGVVVITALNDRAVGMTVQSVASLSLDPPLVLFCPAKVSTTWPSIAQAGHFCMNVLAAGQDWHCAAFARSGGEKFDGIEWRPGKTGAPLLKDALAHVECELVNVYDGGDHEIVIGRVVALDARLGAMPLVFYKGEMYDMSTAKRRPSPWKS